MTSSLVGAGVGTGSALSFTNPLQAIGATSAPLPQSGTQTIFNSGQIVNDSNGEIAPDDNTDAGGGITYNNDGTITDQNGSVIQDPYPPAAAAQTGSATAPASSQGVFSSSFWTDIFLRSIVVITGFIFVSVGLKMFGGQGAQAAVKNIVAAPANAIKKGLS